MTNRINRKDIDRRYAALSEQFNEMSRQQAAGEKVLTLEESAAMVGWVLDSGILGLSGPLPGDSVSLRTHLHRFLSGTPDPELVSKKNIVEKAEKSLADAKHAQELRQAQEHPETLVPGATQLSSPMKVNKPISLMGRK